jgi:hypothetical protein
MIYTHQQGNVVFVEEASSREEAVTRLISRIARVPRGGIDIVECPEHLVSIAEVRELLHGYSNAAKLGPSFSPTRWNFDKRNE